MLHYARRFAKGLGAIEIDGVMIGRWPCCVLLRNTLDLATSIASSGATQMNQDTPSVKVI